MNDYFIIALIALITLTAAIPQQQQQQQQQRRPPHHPAPHHRSPTVRNNNHPRRPPSGHGPHGAAQHARRPRNTIRNYNATAGAAACRCPNAVVVVADSNSGSSWLAELLERSPCSSSFIPGSTRPDGECAERNPTPSFRISNSLPPSCLTLSRKGHPAERARLRSAARGAEEPHEARGARVWARPEPPVP